MLGDPASTQTSAKHSFSFISLFILLAISWMHPSPSWIFLSTVLIGLVLLLASSIRRDLEISKTDPYTRLPIVWTLYGAAYASILVFFPACLICLCNHAESAALFWIPIYVMLSWLPGGLLGLGFGHHQHKHRHGAPPIVLGCGKHGGHDKFPSAHWRLSSPILLIALLSCVAWAVGLVAFCSQQQTTCLPYLSRSVYDTKMHGSRNLHRSKFHFGAQYVL